MIEDTSGLSSLNLAVERTAFTTVLVDYVGDPDEGNGRRLVRN